MYHDQKAGPARADAGVCPITSVHRRVTESEMLHTAAFTSFQGVSGKGSAQNNSHFHATAMTSLNNQTIAKINKYIIKYINKYCQCCLLTSVYILMNSSGNNFQFPPFPESQHSINIELYYYLLMY